MDGRLRLVRDLDPAHDVSSGAPLHELGDDDLMKLVAQRVRDAFRTLVTRYQTRVISICTRSMGSPDEGRETAQEVFVALWQAAPTYDPRGNFPGYLFTLVRNRLRSVAHRLSSIAASGRTRPARSTIRRASSASPAKAPTRATPRRRDVRRTTGP